MTELRIAGFGWRKQRPDPADHLFHELNEVKRADELPVEGGLEPNEESPIWNQLQLGTCVTHGTRGVVQTEAIQQGLKIPDLSRLWVYAYGRRMEGQDLSQDTGMEVRDGIKVFAKYGSPAEKDWPYSDANPGPFQKMPPSSLKTEALQHVAVKYQAIHVAASSGGAPMRTALHNKKSITFGFMVPDYFEDDSVWDPTSGEPLPVPKDPANANYIGGHCVRISRYNFSGKFVSTPSTNRRVPNYFKCANSWDTDWGMEGYFNMDADWFTPRGENTLATDLWIVNLVK